VRCTSDRIDERTGAPSPQATTNFKVTDDEQLVGEALRNRYFSLTTAEPREGTFLTMADAQRRDAAKQCRILDRPLSAKLNKIRKKQ
jgi:hypothetical protein